VTRRRLRDDALDATSATTPGSEREIDVASVRRAPRRCGAAGDLANKVKAAVDLTAWDGHN
jgi:hypothetical protein